MAQKCRFFTCRPGSTPTCAARSTTGSTSTAARCGTENAFNRHLQLNFKRPGAFLLLYKQLISSRTGLGQTPGKGCWRGKGVSLCTGQPDRFGLRPLQLYRGRSACQVGQERLPVQHLVVRLELGELPLLQQRHDVSLLARRELQSDCRQGAIIDHSEVQFHRHVFTANCTIIAQNG